MKLLVTGSSGLIGSECVIQMHGDFGAVFGIDNNMRMDFFGPGGDTRPTLGRLQARIGNFVHRDLDIRDRNAVLGLFKTEKFDVTIHCAAQPSHDLAASRPFDDFEVNALGTLNLLEAARQYCPDKPFLFVSTNKVYGDAPNYLKLKELEKRWDYADPAYYNGIAETFSIDHSKHSIFGASKVAADIMVQEYGRYFGMPAVCYRGGCLTGSRHAAVELHGYLAYIFKCAMEGKPYTIYGYKGKQVRDQIHSSDVAAAFRAYLKNPRPAAVYNLGGGRGNAISILETIDLIKEMTGRELRYTVSDKNRIGDHICYISNLDLLKKDYPGWDIRVSIRDIIAEMQEVYQAGDSKK
jgi:CDP-paratose 2-epimerase